MKSERTENAMAGEYILRIGQAVLKDYPTKKDLENLFYDSLKNTTRDALTKKQISLGETKHGYFYRYGYLVMEFTFEKAQLTGNSYIFEGLNFKKIRKKAFNLPVKDYHQMLKFIYIGDEEFLQRLNEKKKKYYYPEYHKKYVQNNPLKTKYSVLKAKGRQYINPNASEKVKKRLESYPNYLERLEYFDSLIDNEIKRIKKAPK